MVLCDVECVRRISQYLRVSPGNIYVSKNNTIASDGLVENQIIEGFGTIVQALAKRSRCPGIFGQDAETEALIRQWLEYTILRVNYADDTGNAKKILKELDTLLKSNAYLTGPRLTVADVALYHVLHSIMKNLNHQEKAEFCDVSRWFDNVQQDTKLRLNLDLINFDLLRLYL